MVKGTILYLKINLQITRVIANVSEATSRNECWFSLQSLLLCSSFSFFLLVQKEREKEKGPPKTNAPHVLGIALRCYCGEYALSVVSAAHMTVLLGCCMFSCVIEVLPIYLTCKVAEEVEAIAFFVLGLV